MMDDDAGIAATIFSALAVLQERCSSNANHLRLLNAWVKAEANGDTSMRPKVQELADWLDSNQAGEEAATRREPGLAINHLSKLPDRPVPQSDRDELLEKAKAEQTRP